MKRIFRYFEPAWTGNDKKVSLRAILAIAFSIDFIRNLNYAIWKWDAGRSLEGLSLTLGIEAGLIVGLLGLTTYQNLQSYGRGDHGSYGTYRTYGNYDNDDDRRHRHDKDDEVKIEEGKPDVEVPR